MLKKIMLMFVYIPFVFSQTKVKLDSLYSSSLSKYEKISIILPQDYNKGNKYPVIYLLHGLYASMNEWLNQTNIKEYAERFPFIFVMPNADDSWYVNSFNDTTKQYDSYITKDLYNYISKNYSVDLNYEALVGYSMGGYGSLILGLRNPTHYWFIGAMSASLDIPEHIKDLKKYNRDWLAPTLNEAFGNATKKFLDSYDPFILYKSVKPEDLPYIYLVTGIDESFKERILFHRAFSDSLRVYGAKYEYHETLGKHSYKFWNREVIQILNRMKQLLDQKVE